jgi:hypothetical protein
LFPTLFPCPALFGLGSSVPNLGALLCVAYPIGLYFAQAVYLIVKVRRKVFNFDRLGFGFLCPLSD